MGTMRWFWLLPVVAVACGCSSSAPYQGSWFTSTRLPAGSAQVGGVATLGRMIVVSTTQHEVLSPPDGAASPALTFNQAWQRLHHGRRVAVRPGIAVRAGVLTAPQDGVKDRLVYVLLGGPNPCGSSGSAPSGRCLDWDFLDATTPGRIWAPVESPLAPQ